MKIKDLHNLLKLYDIYRWTVIEDFNDNSVTFILPETKRSSKARMDILMFRPIGARYFFKELPWYSNRLI